MLTSETVTRVKNEILSDLEARARSRSGRVICAILPHRWFYVHLFDDQGDPYPHFYGAANYAGVCLRCGKRDLFSGPLRRLG